MEKEHMTIFPKNVKAEDICKKSSRSVSLILSLNFLNLLKRNHPWYMQRTLVLSVFDFSFFLAKVEFLSETWLILFNKLVLTSPKWFVWINVIRSSTSRPIINQGVSPRNFEAVRILFKVCLLHEDSDGDLNIRELQFVQVISGT